MAPPDASLDAAFRAAGGRIVAALAARFRDLDLAEEAFAEACLKAIAAWQFAVPDRPDAWLYRTAERCALDALRKRAVRTRDAAPDDPPLVSRTDEMIEDLHDIPDERLRLIFVCCHPAVAPDSRAALTLKLVCGLTSREIARAFLLTEAALHQRLGRAKRKIADAGVPFEVPAPRHWLERLEAVLATIEIAYSKAHEDAAGAGTHASLATEMLGLSRTLAELLPAEADVLALAATICFAEARRPARLDGEQMVPLAEQDPARWDRRLIRQGDGYLRRAFSLQPTGVRLLQAGIHAAWCRRASLAQPPPWPKVLSLYDGLIALRDDPIVRLNRLVALAEVEGHQAALAQLDLLDRERLADFLPFYAVRADLLRRAGDTPGATAAYRRALELDAAPAERHWLECRLRDLQAENGAAGED